VQLHEHRIFDAAVPVKAAGAETEARYAALAFKTSLVKESGSLAVIADS